MSKEKLAKLVKYADGLKSKLTSPTPEKHKTDPKPYVQFLNRELETVNKNIEAMKMTINDKK